ncbi:epidermal retinol dehydrogenase 2-like [Gigantopelta aegis]|uniref:epidermal retinol dehydrogenase 2-like n=1 Tax=Gigantopelta aegis TaxID=1735272 RepID=UPI001B88BB0B|nr:epidermal retinol dehydrogenase 2-like [Gigantopelta aegis]
MSRFEEKWHNFVNMTCEILQSLRNICCAYVVAFFRIFVSPVEKKVDEDIVLITGSGKGIGRKLSIEFAKRGSRVVLWDIDRAANDKTASIIRELGGKCYPYVCDVSVRSEVYRVGEIVRRDVGDVSILVNNAGVVAGKPLVDLPDELIEQTFNVNLLAHFWTVKCFLPSMLHHNHGHIVNMASSVGLIGTNKLTDYCASKFGVVGFTEVLNYEIIFSGKDGVHTTLVCPSFTNTGMFEGCEMKYPSLLPPLETEDVVQRIMHAILTNQYQICIPKLIYFCAILKTLLPVDGMVEVIRLVGAENFMNKFVGRNKVHKA